MTFASRLVYRFLHRLQTEGTDPTVEDLTDKFSITDGEAAVILADWRIRQQLPYFDDIAETEDS